jgi:hypothetical protein
VITIADALEVMGVVAACHHRTAPRLDDREAALVTAKIWAELFNEYRLEMADLVKAVKKRATTSAEAPEPAEIIAVARAIRKDRRDRETDRSDLEAICDRKAGDVLAEIGRRTGQSFGKSLEAS